MYRALTLFALSAAFVGETAASCREVTNNDMLEYLCEGGHPADLTAVPEKTEKLRIVGTPLGRITADTFSRFGGNLWVLSCSHCEITDIDANAFGRLVNLQQLNLDSNRLETVRASWFEGLNYLTYLDLSYNNIRDIEDGVYGNLPALVDLRISGNRLRCLNLDGMSHLRELKRIFLSENADFACPHAVSEFLESRKVTFEKDPEWRKIASDAIAVHVPPPPPLSEEDRATAPTYRERYPVDERSSPRQQEPETPYVPPRGTGDRPFHSDPHYGQRRGPTRRPPQQRGRTTHLPRVEPVHALNDTRTSHAPTDSTAGTQPYPAYPTPETPRSPLTDPRMAPIEQLGPTMGSYRPPLIDPRMAPIEQLGPTMGSYRPPLMEDTDATYSRPTIPYPPYVTEKSRIPIVEDARPLPEEVRLLTTEADEPPPPPPMSEEDVMTYPSYVPYTPHSSYASTSERPRIPIVESRQPSTSGADAQSLDEEDAATQPIYVTAYDSRGKAFHGTVQLMQPTSPDHRPNTDVWPTDTSLVVPALEARDGERLREQSRYPTERYGPSSSSSSPVLPDEPHYAGREYTAAHGSLEARVPQEGDRRWSSSADDYLFVTNHPVGRGEEDRSQYATTTTMTTAAATPTDDGRRVHYVRPLPPSQQELEHPASMNELYQPPFDGATVTLHPPLQDYRERHGENGDHSWSVSTDDPPADCPQKDSATRSEPLALLTVSIVVAVLGRVVAVGF